MVITVSNDDACIGMAASSLSGYSHGDQSNLQHFLCSSVRASLGTGGSAEA